MTLTTCRGLHGHNNHAFDVGFFFTSVGVEKKISLKILFCIFDLSNEAPGTIKFHDLISLILEILQTN